MSLSGTLLELEKPKDSRKAKRVGGYSPSVVVSVKLMD
jgi:hypothetical protein